MHIKFHLTGPLSKKHCKESKNEDFGTSNGSILLKFGMKFRERLKFIQKKFGSDSVNGSAPMALHTRKHRILRWCQSKI